MFIVFVVTFLNFIFYLQQKEQLVWQWQDAPVEDLDKEDDDPNEVQILIHLNQYFIRLTNVTNILNHH